MGRKRKPVDDGKASCKNANLMGRFAPHYTARDFHILVALIIGITLILIGGIFTFANRIREVPSWGKYGPTIWIAADKPLCDMEIQVFTNDDGTTALRIMEKWTGKALSEYLPQSSDMDENEYHLWVCVNAPEDAPINWTIPKQFCDVKNYELIPSLTGDYYDFFVVETNKSSGTDQVTAFMITFGAAYSGVAEIDIAEDPEHIAFHGNGIYIPRVPCVLAWQGYGQGSGINRVSNELIGRSHNIDDADFTRLSINNRQMYFPMLKITTSYTSPSLVMQHALEPMWISPEPEDGYPLIIWTQYNLSAPIIQYRDKVWESNAKRNNLLGGIFVGLGLNVLLTLTDLYPKKKKRY